MISFSVDSSVEHVVMHTVCTLELPGESSDYVLKVVYVCCLIFS